MAYYSREGLTDERMRVLVIAPHPDDEVLGTGGTIAKHSKRGDEVYLCIVTKAYTPDWSEKFIKNRPNEIAKANNALGIKKTFFLDLPTVKLDTIPQKVLCDLISQCVTRVNPEIVYLPHRGDLNNDHRLVFQASLVALRPLEGGTVSKILSYETLSETEWGTYSENMFVPNVYIDIADTLDDKLKAMSAYQSELREYPHPRSLEMIKVLAQKRGAEAGLTAAEAFIAIRETIR